MPKQLVSPQGLSMLLFELVVLIYGKQEFAELCQSCDLKFHDNQSLNEALFEFIAFGMSLVRIRISQNVSDEINRDLLDFLNKEFVSTIRRGGMSDLEAEEVDVQLRTRIEEYESTITSQGSTRLVVTKIFNRLDSSMRGDISKRSALNLSLEVRLHRTLDGVDTLFNRFEPAA